VKILVIKVAALGDLLMATPALRALKRGAAGGELHLLAGRSIAAAAENNPDVDRVIPLDDRRLFHGGFLGQATEALKAAWRLRRERYDVGLTFHRDPRFALILLLAGCRRRIGFRRGRRRPWALTEAVAVEGIRHHIFHYCDLVRPLGLGCLDFRMEFPVAAAAEAAAAEKFLVPARLKEYVVIAPGGAANVKEEMASRRWPASHFSRLAGRLLEEGHAVVLLGAGGDADIAAAIAAGKPALVDLTGRTTLTEAAALLKRSRLVVCNDAGLMHLASAVGARVLALFGPTHPEEKRPLAEGSVALWKGEGMSCSPCYRDGVFPACAHVDCLARITPEEVFHLADRMLREEKGKTEGRQREEREKKNG